MDGLNWAALEPVAEMLGITDMESFIAQLVALRDWKRDQQG